MPYLIIDIRGNILCVQTKRKDRKKLLFHTRRGLAPIMHTILIIGVKPHSDKKAGSATICSLVNLSDVLC